MHEGTILPVRADEAVTVAMKANNGRPSAKRDRNEDADHANEKIERA